MSQTTPDQPLDADARRTALEVMATLANVKRIAADQILRPAGVPDALVREFLTGRDATTGQALTKRQAGALILEQLARAGTDGPVIRKLVDLATRWDSFHLAAEEFKARAVVQKARELAGVLADSDARERERHEQTERARADRERQDQNNAFRKQSELLLAQFDHAALSTDHHQRGYFLEDLLGRVFTLHGISVVRSFRRNDGGEQIDAAFALDGWHYIVECRWRDKPADGRDLDGLLGQIGRSGNQTMGLFLSINGWSQNVVPLLKQNRDKGIILMDGVDLRTVLAQPFDLKRMIKAKLTALNLDAEPYLPVSSLT